MERGVELLEWQPKDEWDLLCKFLGKEKPEVRFPMLNEAAFMRMVKIFLTVRGLAAWVVMLGAPVVAAYAYMVLK